MGEHVHLSGEGWRGLETLRERIGPSAGFSCGAGVPSETTLLVDGRPDGLDALPRLRALVVPWAGVGAKAAEAARSRGVPVYNLHHNAPATAEAAVGLLLACARRIPRHDRQLREGVWPGRNATDEPGIQLAGKRAVVFG